MPLPSSAGHENRHGRAGTTKLVRLVCASGRVHSAHVRGNDAARTAGDRSAHESSYRRWCRNRSGDARRNERRKSSYALVLVNADEEEVERAAWAGAGEGTAAGDSVVPDEGEAAGASAGGAGGGAGGGGGPGGGGGRPGAGGGGGGGRALGAADDDECALVSCVPAKLSAFCSCIDVV